MLAVFGEMEDLAAKSARVKAARRAIITPVAALEAGTPFGFMNVKNPEGLGMVLAHDRERIDYVREMVVPRFPAGFRLLDRAVARRVRSRARKRGGRKKPERWYDASVEVNPCALRRSPG